MEPSFPVAGVLNFLKGLSKESERNTGIFDSYIITVLASVCLFLILGYGPYVLCDLIVLFYPAYQSFQALEQEDHAKVIYWMKYWIVFGFYQVVTRTAGDSVLKWFPGYFYMKFLFLLWCLAPVEMNGAEFIYENFIRPAFLKNNETMDNLFKIF